MSSQSSTGCSEGGRDPAPPATHTVPPRPDPRRPASAHAVDVPSSQDVEVPVSPAVDLLQPPDVDLSQPQDVNVPAASHLPPLPPDGGYGWVVVFACFCCNGIVEGSVGSFGVFLPHFTEAFSSSRAKATIAGSLLIGGFLISGKYCVDSSSFHIGTGEDVTANGARNGLDPPLINYDLLGKLTCLYVSS